MLFTFVGALMFLCCVVDCIYIFDTCSVKSYVSKVSMVS